jgi:uncharacterized protein YndB with AHSA1/START domain
VSQAVAFFPVEPVRVFAVLADPSSFSRWVVGTDRLRSADPDWPAPGSKLHHSIGIGPLSLNDHTEVLEAAPPHRLALRAHVRPLGTTCVTLDLAEHDAGVRVTLTEEPADLIARMLTNPLTDPLLALRNRELLRRLGALAGALTA